MYLKLTDKEMKVIKDVEKMTTTSAGLIGDMLPIDNVINMFEDLLYEIDVLEEKYKDLERKYYDDTDR